jgi:hypothetical protein
MIRVFCVGNGESRIGFDLNKLKPFGKIYGCNALYREFSPDVLTAVDHGIMHEIYHSGYALNNECYFRDWTYVPDNMYQSIVYQGLTKNEIEFCKKWDVHKENEKPENSVNFVMHGSNLSGVAQIIQKITPETGDNVIKQMLVNSNQLCVSWINPDDKARSIKDILGGHDFGWAAGPTSANIAVKKEKPDEVYLIGHDLNSTHGKVNNVYKNTKHYLASSNKPTTAINWFMQLKTLFNENQNIKFFKVDKQFTPINNQDMVNRKWDQWGDSKNLSYITYEELDKKLGL